MGGGIIMMPARCFFLIYLFFSPLIAFSGANNEWYSTARTLSMGNAGIAFVDSPAAAMFYNPAGLASIRKPSSTFLDLQFHFSSLNFNSGIADTLKYLDLEKALPLLDENRDQATSSGFSIYPNVSSTYLSFGILTRVDVGAIKNEAGELYYHSKYYLIPTVGLSMPLFNGIWKLGIAVRAIQAAENNERITDFSNIGYKVNPRKGFGLGLDAGLIWTFPSRGLPALGVVLRNIGDTKLNRTEVLSLVANEGRLHNIKVRTVDLGFSFQPKISRKAKLNFVADFRDINKNTGLDRRRRLNLGLELEIRHSTSFRVGLGRGYVSGGIGFHGKNNSFDITTYGEELDPKNYREVLDRRFVFYYGRKL